MNSRERVESALNHKEPDRVPLDFGGSPVTGIHSSLVYKLRQALGLKEKPVRIIECYQMLGEIEDDLVAALEIDTVKILDYSSMFGFPLSDYKPFQLYDGTPVLVPGMFNTKPEENGDFLSYPQGDTAAKPSGHMPKGGFYFDAIIRQRQLDEANLDPADNLEEFAEFDDAYLKYVQQKTDELYTGTDRAIVGIPGGTALGDIALVPAVQLKDPKGIRDIEEWYVSTLLRKEYVCEVFEKQTDIALKNLKMYYQAAGDKISVIYLCGTDFGTQNAPFCSADVFREMYLPYYLKMTTWIHENTNWKVFKHSCGAIEPLIDLMAEAGFDILNPVQCSAAGMDPAGLKDKYSGRVAFWGGGVDTQKTLPFGTADEVRQQVSERVNTFKPGGGFVFNTIHNAQPDVPIENFLAMIDAFKQNRDY